MLGLRTPTPPCPRYVLRRSVKSTTTTAEHRLLPRYRLDDPIVELARRDQVQAAVLVQALNENPGRSVPLRETLTKPGDAMALRGLPAIARGVSGVSPGTDPLREAIRSDERAERLRLG